MPLTVLSDKEVDDILHSLTRSDIERFQHNLAEALHDYSTGTQEETSACSQNQPLRTVLKSQHGTTLFMPAQNESVTGIKVVTVGASASQSFASSSADTPRASTRPNGTLSLLDPMTGSPLAFLAASSLTAFRTALASTILFAKRTRVHSILVFGAGAQAYWHIRLACLLRGHEIHHVRIVNRSYSPTLLQTFYTDPRWTELRAAANPKLDFSMLSTEYGDYERLLKQYVRDADAIFGCTPSTEALFPAAHLTSTEGRRKGRYLCLIGSYQPHMREVEPEVLHYAVRDQSTGRHLHKHAKTGGAVVVDTLEGCLEEAGEVIAAGLGPEQLVEVGELIMVRKAEKREIEMGTGEESGMVEWLREGNVVYKSVGVGVMDLCVGRDVVELARERGVGTSVDGF